MGKRVGMEVSIAAAEAVNNWHKEQSERAFNERYFALTMGADAQVGPSLSNYHIWWSKIQKSLDPNGVSPEAGALV